MNLCVAILMLKVKEKKQRFQHIILYYFKKGQNTAETQRLVQWMETVPWLIRCVKSSLQSFVLEISC